MGWIPEHDNALRRHLADKMSFTEAAAAINGEFRTRYSRNAAIGRANRIGLKSFCKKTGGLSHHPRAKRRPRTIAKPQPRQVQFACELITGLRIADVVPRHILLLDLTDATCKWPYGDGPFTFCGCETFEGPYCEPHAALSAKPMQGVNFNQTEHQRAAHRKSRMPTIVSLARDMDAA